MHKQIITDRFLLSRKSTPATKDDIPSALDLRDTFNYINIQNINRESECVGLAANQIGVFKTILVLANDKKKAEIIINPVIIKHSQEMIDSTEGCMSLPGTQTVKRYPVIKVEYVDEHFKKRTKTFRNIQALVVQHEMDHFAGKLI